jgi:hypothetical protein
VTIFINRWYFLDHICSVFWWEYFSQNSTLIYYILYYIIYIMSYNYAYASLPTLNENQIGYCYSTTNNRAEGTVIQANSSVYSDNAVVCKVNGVSIGYYLVTYSLPATNIDHVIYASLQWNGGSSPNNYFAQTNSDNDWSNVNGTYYINITENNSTIDAYLYAPVAAGGYNGSCLIPYQDQCWLQAIRIA